MSLVVAPCSHEAAKFAALNYHYAEAMPAGKLISMGAWEAEKFIGAVLFGRGANHEIGSPYGLAQTEVCELVRVALREHTAPVSQIVAYAIRALKRTNPGLRLIVSYADPEQGHKGGIYQAMNWIYTGPTKTTRHLVINGEEVHKRSAWAKYGSVSPEVIEAKSGLPTEWGPAVWKHTYLMPLDRATRRLVLPLSKPYPKHAADQGDSFASSGVGRFDPDPAASSSESLEAS